MDYSPGSLTDGLRRGSATSDVMMNEDRDATNADMSNPSGMSSGSRQAHPSAYMAPAHVRAQAEPDHSRGGVSGNARARGELTADNLAGIPEADQVAPGIRLENMGAEYLSDAHTATNQDLPRTQAHDGADVAQRTSIMAESLSRLDGEGHTMHLDGPSSTGMSGRSSTGAIDNEDGSQDVGEGDDVFQEAQEDSLVHERVGGSGATSENASKGTSVGHFGPRGEAIPGVPPHLDPRQPHFRPPSPSAASVFSVAVQPPVSPKMQASSGGHIDADTPSGDTVPTSMIDSGDETESFDNGVATPTRSEDDDDEGQSMGAEYGEGVQSKLGTEAYLHNLDREQTPASSTPYALQRLQLHSDGQHTPGSVSFNPIVTSHRGSVSSFYSGRAPSIAATAGSSRAPSARGISPPPSASRAGTSSSIEEFDSTGTGLIGETGNETPSVGRSRRSSSYSAPSSEAADAGVGAGGVAPGHADDGGNRGRGATLVPSSSGTRGNIFSYANLAEGNMQPDDDDLRSQPTDGPSLAPSEAGSDSTRSVANDSSLGHGVWTSAGGTTSGAGIVSDRYTNAHQWSQHSPVILEPSGGVGTDGSSPHTGAAGSGFKGTQSFVPPPPPAAQQAALPHLLAIKRAAHKQSGSAAASTAGATAGTASPTGSLSVDGDVNEGAEEYVGQEAV